MNKLTKQVYIDILIKNGKTIIQMIHNFPTNPCGEIPLYIDDPLNTFSQEYVSDNTVRLFLARYWVREIMCKMF